MQAILLFGGTSDERLVSVASAQNLISIIPDMTPWFVAPDGTVTEVDAGDLASHQRPFETQFVPARAPFAKSLSEAIGKTAGRAIFIALHGGEGEDGTLQRMLEQTGVPFTGSGSEASAACFDKVVAKKRVAEKGVAVAAQLILDTSAEDKLHRQLVEFRRLHTKIVVKPAASGSSVGLHIVDDESTLRHVAKAVMSTGLAYMAEQFLAGREITVGVAWHDGRLSAIAPSEALVQKGRTFDYQGKYLGHGIKEVTPAELTSAEAHACTELAVQVHRDLGCYGYSRTDMILTANGPVYLETNTLPGLSKSSFVPQQLACRGIKLTDFVRQQLELALKRP
jgi:D-alanine-D-alanine ligase